MEKIVYKQNPENKNVEEKEIKTIVVDRTVMNVKVRE
jgi:hypothetical protein